jgi:Putative motility protein
LLFLKSCSYQSPPTAFRDQHDRYDRYSFWRIPSTNDWQYEYHDGSAAEVAEGTDAHSLSTKTPLNNRQKWPKRLRGKPQIKSIPQQEMAITNRTDDVPQTVAPARRNIMEIDSIASVVALKQAQVQTQAQFLVAKKLSDLGQANSAALIQPLNPQGFEQAVGATTGAANSGQLDVSV